MHRLLRRQLKRHVADPVSLPQEVRALLDEVDMAYRQEDDDRRMLEHSLETMSQELMERNDALRNELAERRASEERLAYLANYDPLTRLPNRNLLIDRLHCAIQHAERESEQLAVLFLDLDNFKNINDTLGHAVGDRVLEETAARLDGCCRKSDTIARLGGDEYTLLITNLAQCDEAARVARELLGVFAKPFLVDGREVFCTASIGIAVYPADAQNIDDLLKHADAAMYRAKEQGRNHYQFFTADMNRRAMERMLLCNSLRRALDRGEFRLHYQPQLDLTTGRCAGLEALLRWEHPELGLVMPGDFISMLEETGAIVPVGDWLLREACRFNAALPSHGLESLRLSVNFSVRQLRQPDLLERVSHVLRQTGLDPRHLELELTESVLAEAHLDTTSIGGLRAMGVGFVIDDFGTGYSSLGYLKRFPIDSLKVDQSFVRDVLTDIHSAEITSAVISLGHTLHLNVIAEGVETAEQVRFLRQKGCHEVQGFIYAKPMPGNELIRWLREHRSEPRMQVLHAAAA